MNEDAWELPNDMRGLMVLDVNGAFLGRVERAEPGRLDVVLSRSAERRFGVHEVEIPLGLIVDADDHEVTLREEARFVVHPGDRVVETLGE